MAQDSIYIISDDAPFVYQVSMQGNIQDSIRLRYLPDNARRIPKPVKPDYEAAITATVWDKPCLIAFGSGSLRPQRDSAIIIALDDSVQRVIALSELYKTMREQAGISAADFNVEAAALHGNQLLLVNRGTNHVFSMDWEAALYHLLNSAPIPAISFSRLVLPKVNGYSAGISGACSLDANRVLFCASVEATDNWIADGEVLGSYIGLMEPDSNGLARLLEIARVLSESGQPVKDKVEGIHTAGTASKSSIKVLGIVDNDDGSTQLLEISLKNIPLP